MAVFPSRLDMVVRAGRGGCSCQRENFAHDRRDVEERQQSRGRLAYGRDGIDDPGRGGDQPTVIAVLVGELDLAVDIGRSDQMDLVAVPAVSTAGPLRC